MNASCSAWANYYNNPGDTGTWKAFCQAGGATYSRGNDAGGVPACGPTDDVTGQPKIYIPGSGSATNWAPLTAWTPSFQCVELAERYLFVKYGWSGISGTNGGAVVKHYANAHSLTPILNGEGIPAIGDVMSFADDSSFDAPDGHPGHVAIVVSVDPKKHTVTIVGENQNTINKRSPNFTAGQVTMKATVTSSGGWSLTSFDSDRNIEWLHVAGGSGGGGGKPGGTQLWVSRYDSGNSDSASDMALSPDGTKVFVTGNSGIVAYDASTGAQLWVVPTLLADAVAISPDGSKVFVTGAGFYGGSSGYDYVTVAYDASSGAQLWLARYDYGASDSPADVGVSPNGSKVFVTGQSTCGPVGSTCGRDDYATVAYDAATGMQVWAARYATTWDSSAFAVAVSPDSSRLFVVGFSRSSSATNGDYATVAYDSATGAQLWVARYDSGVDDFPDALVVSPDGSKVFVAGRSQFSFGYDYSTVAYAASSGVQLWSTQASWGPGYLFYGDLAVSADGSKLFLVGHGASNDAATVAYDSSTGTQLWFSSYDTGGSDAAVAVVASPNASKVFVTGWTYNGSHHYVTVAYDASTGAQLWVASYDTGGDDLPTAAAVSPDGSRVFITGESNVACSSGSCPAGYDYATVAYASG